MALQKCRFQGFSLASAISSPASSLSADTTSSATAVGGRRLLCIEHSSIQCPAILHFLHTYPGGGGSRSTARSAGRNGPKRRDQIVISERLWHKGGIPESLWSLEAAVWGAKSSSRPPDTLLLEQEARYGPPKLPISRCLEDNS